MGKGCHPLTAVLYLKQVEGITRNEKPIRPKYVSARMHSITRNKNFEDKGFLRSDYFDIEDYAQIHIVFDDGMVADIFSTELVMGGVHNWLEVFANNHRMKCNINPVDACVLYNPKEEQMKDVYIVEKTGTKQGWSFPSPDEDWMTGYKHELQDFMECIEYNRVPVAGGILASDTITTIYSAYLSNEKNGIQIRIPQI
jgi:predicted dehydrogenase